MENFENKHKNNANLKYFMNVLSSHCAKAMQVSKYYLP